MTLAGIWQRWQGQDEETPRDTVSIITTEANPLMRKIHNGGANAHRMPVRLPQELERTWLEDIDGDDPVAVQGLQELLVPYDEGEMTAYTVPKIRGKASVGNSPKAHERYTYEELTLFKDEGQMSLF